MNYIAKAITSQTQSEMVSEILGLLRPLLRQCEDLVREPASDRVTPAMFRLLSCLQVDGAQTAPALARSLGTGRQHIQRMVNGLLTIGAIERRKNPAHQTSWLIALTEMGLAHVQRVISREHEELAELADGITGGDLQACLGVLDHFMNQLNDRDRPRKAGRAARQPVEEQSLHIERERPEGFQDQPIVAAGEQAREQALDPAHDAGENAGLERDGPEREGPDQNEPERSEAGHSMPAAGLNWNGGGGLRIG